MKNPLKNDRFDKYQATKNRSPLFRAIVVLLLLFVSGFIVYMMALKKNKPELATDIEAQPGVISTK